MMHEYLVFLPGSAQSEHVLQCRYGVIDPGQVGLKNSVSGPAADVVGLSSGSSRPTPMNG